MRNESPLLTDLYQFTMMQGYFDKQMQETAVFEFFTRKLPKQRQFLVAAGLEQVIEYLAQLHFTDQDIEYLQTTGLFHDEFLAYLRGLTFQGDVHAMPEGTVFFPDEPIIRITAPLPVAQLVETRIINILQFQTMIASKAARIKLAAPDKILLDFGLRRAHGAEAGLFAARASYLAGFTGSATVQAGQVYGIPIYGTMAHSFIQCHDSERQAFFDFATSQQNNVVLLIDTYDTEQGARKVVDLASELADKNIPIKGVRIDSGDLATSTRTVRRILDEGGLEEVKIFLSSSLDEYSIDQLCQDNVPVDGFGIGTKMTTSSDYSFLDCAYKLVEYKNKGRRKRSTSKMTWPGRKQVFREYDKDGLLIKDTLGLHTETLQREPLIEQVIEQGRFIGQKKDLNSIRQYTQEQMATLPPTFKKIEPADTVVPVEISSGLRAMTAALDA